MPPTLRRVLPPVLDRVPDAPEPSVPRMVTAFLPEWRTALLPARLLLDAPALARAPRGDGGPVVDVPGWRAPELTMAPLRGYLRWLGYDARGWGGGTNLGDPRASARTLAERVREVHAETGRRVALVGWSLGGVVARGVARREPALVRRVVTYGTPVVGGPAWTVGASSFGPSQSRRISRTAERVERRDPIRVPVTAIYTRRDAVVSWPACIDRFTPGVRHVEVSSTHLGLGLDPDVWRIVADQLAEPADGLRDDRGA
jgi:pimeloyl-ACP methyl ester carboxylesterase